MPDENGSTKPLHTFSQNYLSGCQESVHAMPTTYRKGLKCVWIRSVTAGHRNNDTYQDYDGALNFATDAWTSPNHKAYVAVTVHFQRDGILVAMLLDLVEVAESHSGAHLAAVFVKILEDFAITDKVSALLYRFSLSVLTIAQILSITCDNASNNDTMVEALKDQLEIFPGDSNRTRCFDNIVNLIAKSVIQQFDVPKTKGNESFDDVLWELMVSAEELEKEELATKESECWASEVEREDDDLDGWVNEQEGMSEPEQKEIDDNVQPIRRMLVKVSVAALCWLCLC